jgi:hypothetical protein
VPHTLDVTRIPEVLEAVKDNSDRLNDWERNFITTIADQWDRKQWLSDKQIEILEKIHVRLP